MIKLYFLQHSRPIENSEPVGYCLGVFTTRKEAEEALPLYLESEGFRDYPNDFSIQEYVLDQKTWLEGYVIGKNIPSWARGAKKLPNETAEEFAHRLCKAKYGENNYLTYSKTADSEFYKLVKYWEKL